MFETGHTNGTIAQAPLAPPLLVLLLNWALLLFTLL